MKRTIQYGELLEKIEQVEIEGRAPWLPACLALMWLTGGRVSEVLQLRVENIEISMQGEEVVTIRLTNLKQRGVRKDSTKDVYVVPRLYPAVWERVTYWMGVTKAGRMFTKTRQVVWHHCQRLFKVGSHSVGRHSWVMERAARGSTLWDVKQMGGWTKLESMNSYVHPFEKKGIVERMVRGKAEAAQDRQGI